MEFWKKIITRLDIEFKVILKDQNEDYPEFINIVD